MNRVAQLTAALILTLASLHSAVAQYSEQQTDALRSSADRLTERSMQERDEARVLALQQQLPLRQVLPDGSIIELQRFERGRPVYYITDNAVAAASISSDKLYPGGSMGFALTGNGATLGVWDGGSVRTTHQEFTGRVTQMDGTSGLSDHSTHVAGTMIASGVKPQARGMAYEAQLLAHDWTNDLGEMTSRAATGLQVSNHSYSTVTGWRYNYRNDGRWVWFGDPNDNAPEDRNFGIYDNNAREWDALVHAAPYYLPVKSAGNDRGEGPSNQPLQHWEYQNGWKLVNNVRDLDGGSSGYDCITTNGNAKNILTVGAVEDIPGGYSTSTDVRMTSFSGWGPTDDGRIKPDLVANGTSLYSTLRSSNTAYASNSGTSMSSPSVAGSIGLLLQHQAKLHGGERLRASTIRALLLHSADEAGPAPGPDYMYGWGMMNTAAAAKIMQQDADGSNSNFIREEELLGGSSLEYQVYSPGRGPIKVTICWTDLAGTAQPSKVDPTNRVLVNDLDLRLIDPQSAEHMPWVLDPSNPSAAARHADNIVDNVEQVFISAPVEGMYTIRISHKGNLQGGSQIVSLVASVSNAPSLMSPPSGLTSLSPTAMLQWTPARGALSYDVQVSATPDFKTPIINARGITDPWMTLSGLQRLATYYWQVRVEDQQGKSDWSDVWSFETGGVPALAGHALYFDGADDQAVLPHSSGFDVIEQQDVVTLEAWVQVLSWHNGYFPIVDKHDASADLGWMLRVHSGRGIELVASTSAACTFVPKLGEWNHIAVSYSRSTGKARFYVNGSRQCEVDYNGDIRETNGGPLYAGCSPSGTDEFAHGVIDELRIWNSARTENEINATMYSNLSGSESGLVAQLRFDEGRGLTTAALPASSEALLTAGPAWLVSSVPMDVPPVPVLLYPGQNTANVPVRPQLRWMPSTSANSYRVQLSAFADFSDLLLDQRNVTETEREAPQLDAESEYYWRVNATNAVGTSGWSVAHRFVTAIAPPAAPVLVSPRLGSKDQPLLVTLLWEAPDRAQRYHVQVSTDSLFEEAFLLDRSDLISPSADVKDLGNYQKYFWRVAASNVGGTGPWSEIWSFTTLPAEPEAPVLLLPAADATGVSSTPQFSWRSVESAATYHMQLATDTAFNDLLLDAATIPFTQYAAANLADATWHYWRVRAANSAGKGPWSAVRRFLTVRPAPEQVLLTTPADNELDVAPQPEFTWQAAVYAETYRIEIAEEDSFTAPVHVKDGVSGTSHIPQQQLVGGVNYFWRVRAENESGAGAWSAVWSLTIRIPLEAPVLIAPDDESEQEAGTLAFTWFALHGAEGYEFELADGVTTDADNVSDTTITASVFPSSEYQWRVRAKRGQETGPWSETWSFTTPLELPGAVTLIEAEEDEDDLVSPVRFSWTTGTPRVTRYWHEYARDEQFSSDVRADSSITDTVALLEVQVPGGEDFWWRVRAGNAAGWGPWSEIRRNRLLSTGASGAQILPAEPRLHGSYPNPVHGNAGGAVLVSVRFTLPQRMHARIELRDLLGRLAAPIADGDYSPGTQDLRFDLSALPAGQYLISLRTASGIYSRVLTLIR